MKLACGNPDIMMLSKAANSQGKERNIKVNSTPHIGLKACEAGKLIITRLEPCKRSF